MKKFNFFSLMIVALIMGLSFSSCEEDESLLATDEEEDEEQSESVPKIVVSEGELTDSASTTVYVSDLEEGAEEVEVTVEFSSEDDKMRRLYMTENLIGAGADKYELDIEGLSKKGDGSVDLSRDSEAYGFTFSIPFPVLSDMSEGTVTYDVWATSGRGDYRDSEKKLVAGPGTITINYGGENPDDVEINEYEATLLAAPLADGTSETFISLVDGDVYAIEDGEEFAAYWDFGYYYGAAGETKGHEASLASTSTYEETFQVEAGTPVVDVSGIAGTSELNDCFFASSSLDFDAVSTSSDLDDISTPSSQSINGLSVGDVVEFVDNYGKKGLIKVKDIEGTYNSGDYIELDIKVQP